MLYSELQTHFWMWQSPLPLLLQSSADLTDILIPLKILGVTVNTAYTKLLDLYFENEAPENKDVLNLHKNTFSSFILVHRIQFFFLNSQISRKNTFFSPSD